MSNLPAVAKLRVRNFSRTGQVNSRHKSVQLVRKRRHDIVYRGLFRESQDPLWTIRFSYSESYPMGKIAEQ